jgi:hypothetical protein
MVASDGELTGTNKSNGDGDHMFDVTIHLRAGQSITVRVADMKIRKAPLTGSLTSLEWEHPAFPDMIPQLKYIRLEAIEAIEARPVDLGPDGQVVPSGDEETADRKARTHAGKCGTS